MRRRRGRRPAAVVDHIKADDGPEFQTLVKRIAELGFGQASFTKRSVTLDVSEYFVVMVDDLAGRYSPTRSPVRRILQVSVSAGSMLKRAAIGCFHQASHPRSPKASRSSATLFLKLAISDFARALTRV